MIKPSNFGLSVVGCIGADFCGEDFIGKLWTRSTRLHQFTISFIFFLPLQTQLFNNKKLDHCNLEGLSHSTFTG